MLVQMATSFKTLLSGATHGRRNETQNETRARIPPWNNISALESASKTDPMAPLTTTMTPPDDDCRATSPKLNEEDLDNDTDDDIQGHQKEKQKSTKTVGPESDSARSPRRGGGPGGAAEGRGPGGGSGERTSPFNQSAASGNIARKRNRDSTSATGNTVKRARTHLVNVQIRPDDLHLAFNCRKEGLHSSGFSHFTKIRSENPLDLPPSGFSSQKTASLSPRLSVASIDSDTPPATSSNSQAVFPAPTVDPTTTSAIPPFTSQSSPLSGHKNVGSSVQAGDPSSQTLQASPSHLEEHESNVVDKAGVILEKKIAGKLTKITTWLGKLYCEGPLGDGREPLPVVVKMADWRTDSEAEEGTETTYGRTLRREAEVYEHIARKTSESDSGLEITPPFYGIFENAGSIVLVLGYGGERLKNLNSLEKEGKQVLFEKMVNLHAMGIKHYDVATRNILEGINGTHPLITDFELSEREHKCPGRDQCKELVEFYGTLGLQED